MAKKPLIFFKIMVYFSIENWYTFRLTNTNYITDNVKVCFLQEKNAQSCKEKYTILQEKVHKKCVFFY